ncbi:MAG: hypothetical protein CM1200mP1_16700 [Candidatus Neomarinimicrobiota bacterium]|nr:MAG: hypothetical protein CM1200mP1_16700 [Candidatus Neomarinimicrobiota bacterium]
MPKYTFPNPRKDCVNHSDEKRGFRSASTEITFIARGDVHLAIDLANKNDKNF